MQAIVAWVEMGRAPDQLLAELRDNAGKVARSRPLFPYRRAAKYTGHGSTDDAANFAPSTPNQPVERDELKTRPAVPPR
jgi:feruloyl esterase